MVVAPNDTESPSLERHGAVTITRFNYFFKRCQKIAYGHGGVPVNLSNHPWLFLLMPFFLVAFLVRIYTTAKECDVIHVNWIPTGCLCALLLSLIHI